MGLACSKQGDSAVDTAISVEDKQDALQSTDPEMYEFWKRSVSLFDNRADGSSSNGQVHLLYNKKHHPVQQQQQQQQQQQPSSSLAPSLVLTTLTNNNNNNSEQFPKAAPPDKINTKLLIRRHPVRRHEEGISGTHIYACRMSPKNNHEQAQEQRPMERAPLAAAAENTPRVVRHAEAQHNAAAVTTSVVHVDQLFSPAAMAQPPARKVASCVTVSEEHRIYVLDTGMSKAETEHLIAVTELAGRGQYTAYTYAKQTLGCRDHPTVAVAVQAAVHSVVAGVLELQEEINQRETKNQSSNKTAAAAAPPRLLALDDREPHMVKYDVTRKERQRIDMHTDKSEWTFLVALSNGGGLDYSGGGTYFECLDATVHVQRGHALVFPGTLRHCGQRIHIGLRFLLVGFLVDKAATPKSSSQNQTSTSSATQTGSTTSPTKTTAAMIKSSGGGTPTVGASADSGSTAPRTTTQQIADVSDEGDDDSGDDDELVM